MLRIQTIGCFRRRVATKVTFALILAFGMVSFLGLSRPLLVMMQVEPSRGVGSSLQWYSQISQEVFTKSASLINENDNRVLLSSVTPSSASNVDRYHAYEKEQEWEWFDLPDFSDGSSNVAKNYSCSCLNPLAAKECCVRTFRRAHKMGFVVGGSTFTNPIKNSINWRRGLPNSTDYRDVVLVRDFYDSLTSGYLYHKSGRECWLNLNGKKDKRTTNGYHDFDEFLLKFLPHEPPKNNRTLCRYLADEEETVGMRVYIDFIFHDGYQDILRMWRYQQIPSQKHKIHFVCYSDMVNPERDLALVEEVLDFFFPNKTVPQDFKNKIMKRAPSRKAVGYAGGHSTTKDKNTRSRLHSLIHQLDVEHFGGMVAWAASLFPSCHRDSFMTESQSSPFPAVAPNSSQ